jgi:hypothetical protein
MPTLKNPKHERFAQLAATGMSARESYRNVYKAKDSTCETNGPQLLRKTQVAARIAEIRGSLDAEALADCLMTLREKREFLAAVVRAVPGELDEKSPVVQSFKQTVGGREIRLCDKLRALEIDAKLAGEFTEKQDVTCNLSPSVITEGQLREIQERRLAAMKANEKANKATMSL